MDASHFRPRDTASVMALSTSYSFRFDWRLILVLLSLGLSGCEPYASGPLSQDVYVWQRVWTEAVAQAVGEAPVQSRGRIREVVPLAAEVAFRNGQPTVIRPALNYDALKKAPSCGLALRIAPYAGPFSKDDAIGRYLQKLACTLVNDARKSGCQVTELQVDFDCAESKLEGYRVWVSVIREALAALPEPVVISITVLPSWMNRPEFGSLVREAGRYVLQVHSAELPQAGEEPVLCDPARARRWVDRAAAFGVPFRVALPTYTSLVAVSPAGKVVGVSNEGTHPAWPADARTLTARSNAPELAQLVREWTRRRPAAMTGMIWYRMPVSSDRMNWRWPTLAAVMEGREPRGSMRLEASPGNPSDIRLVNEGERDESIPRRVRVRWEGAALISSDALNGFALENAANHAIFTSNSGREVLAPGESRVIGWLRLGSPAKIYVTEN
jgi:hypothetical protein